MDGGNAPRRQAPAFRADELWQALDRLDRMLARAAAAFDAAAPALAAGAPPDPYRGPYVTSADGRRLARRSPGEPAAAGGDPDAAGAPTPESRWTWLRQAFGLEPIDLDIVLIALAPEVDLRYELQFACLQRAAAPRPPTVDLVLNLLCGSRDAKIAARERFAPHAPLARHRLLQAGAADSPAPAPLLARHLKLDDSVARFLLGQAWLDARLQPYARLQAARPGSPGSRAEAIGQIMEAGIGGGGAHFYLEGPAGGDQGAAVDRLAATLRAAVVTAALGKMEPAGFEDALQLLFREAQLLGAVLHLAGLDALAERQLAALAELLDARADRPEQMVLVVSGARPCDPRLRTMASIPVAAPGFRARRALWAAGLRAHHIALDAGAIDQLASRYRLSGAQIEDAIARADQQAALRHAMPGSALLAQAARLQGARDPAPLARKLVPRHGWDELVLPGDQVALLREMCSQARYRHVVYDDWGFDRKLSLGKGLSALFTGPPGTGKTMAVEVIANDLGLELFKVDLSQVVSKYIGETEKGLDRLFAEAREGNAILFFDECDALFGKRTMVQDAHDRYANIEVAYLLQKLEEHEGMCILATNLRPNLDVAFTRRLGFIIEFPFPDEQSRRRLWHAIWPEQVPRSKELDLEFMATQFRLSGGAVKNIALAAAFRAARDGAELRTEHLLWAARSEIEKSGQRVAACEFGPYVGQVEALAGEGAA